MGIEEDEENPAKTIGQLTDARIHLEKKKEEQREKEKLRKEEQRKKLERQRYPSAGGIKE